MNMKVFDTGYIIYDNYLDAYELRSNGGGLYRTRHNPSKIASVRNKRFKGRYAVIKVELREVEDDAES